MCLVAKVDVRGIVVDTGPSCFNYGDGVIRELLNGLNISQGWFCEFGAWDGKYSSNTSALLLKKSWSGVMSNPELSGNRFPARCVR